MSKVLIEIRDVTGGRCEAAFQFAPPLPVGADPANLSPAQAYGLEILQKIKKEYGQKPKRAKGKKA